MSLAMRLRDGSAGLFWEYRATDRRLNKTYGGSKTFSIREAKYGRV
jgi:hypothetical protein